MGDVEIAFLKEWAATYMAIGRELIEMHVPNNNLSIQDISKLQQVRPAQ